MAKLYTAAEWARLMKSLPPEDREPYYDSPEVPEFTVRPTTAAPTTAEPTTAVVTTTSPTTAVPTTVAPTTTTTAATTPRPDTTTTQVPQNFTGDGTQARPLLLNGQKFTGERNGIKYENGLFIDATRADVLQANREANVAAEAAARAATDPKFDIQNRPEGEINENFIIYYSWVGTSTSGQWKSYRVALTPENMIKYGSRAFGGETQAEYGSTTGQTALKKQPLQIRDKDGKIIGYELDGKQFFYSGFTGNTTVAPTTTTTAATTPRPDTTTIAPGTTTIAPGTTTKIPGTTTMAPSAQKIVVSTYIDPTTGDIYSVFSDNSRLLLAKGTKTAEQTTERRSAFQLLRDEFNRYGLADLVGNIENLIISGVSPQEFAIELRKTPVYEKRFAANKVRISKGLQALSEAEYIGLEDEYQERMRRYGLPKSYYEPGQYGIQTTFQRLLENDISPIELEDRIQTAQNRIIYANPEIGIALKIFYPDITNGDILAYALDPDKALAQIKRRVTAAEIGSTAVQLGLTTNVTDAEYLARYGVTKEQAQQGYRTISSGLQRGSQLSSIYGGKGIAPYTQTTAEQEVFNVPGAVEAERQRKKIIKLEQAQFGGSSRVTGETLARERAGEF
jgi:hypothetical protein